MDEPVLKNLWDADVPASDPRFTLAAALAHAESPHLCSDLGALLHQKPLGLPLLPEPSAKVDLFIDASLPPGFSSRLDLALRSECPLVVGTTGLSGSDWELLEKSVSRIPIFHSPNFSIGMALLNKFSAIAARLFPAAAQIDLIETHHCQKKDAPSGSALLLAKTVQEAGRGPVSIHSLRSGKIVGEHTLLFNTAEERLTIAHEAHSRDAFASGALAAAFFLAAQKPGLYGMEDLLK